MPQLEYPNKNLFMLSAHISREIANVIELTMVHGYRIVSNKEEATEGFVLELPSLKPGFAIVQILCMEVPWDTFLEEASMMNLN